jgi:NAD(P)-dependent dehydrogenase (short-subunit alcohol dehydrogenase family)
MASPIKEKVIVVTGGAGLIGQSFVKSIVQNGGIAVIADIDIEAAELLAKNYAGRAETIYLDITSKESITSLINNLEHRHGHINAVVNNAYPHNANYGRKLEDVSYVDFCENINMHLGGYFLIAQQFCIAFKRQGYGNIVNMSSIYGSMTPRFEIYKGTSMTMPVEYAAIKAAIEQLTRYFAQYYKGDGIRINSLSPGGILASQPKVFVENYNKYCGLKGMLATNDLLGGLMFLLSDDSKFMTGQNLMIDDGFSL